MPRKCIIISGGEKSCIPKIKTKEFVIACDKGYRYAVEDGIIPDLFIGDFDSYDGKIKDGINVLKYKKEKDDTDTHLAVKYAVENGFKHIEIYCASGGRTDHFYANIQSCAYAAGKGILVKMADNVTEIIFIKDRSIEIDKKENYSLSVFSQTDICEGVDIKGTLYEAEDTYLTNSFPIGVSNEWKDDKAFISVKKGILMIILSKY